MFARILIANRGEIACRIVRTARRLGIATVAVYSDADAAALHTTMADEARPIGAAPPRESYLNGERILAAARDSGAQAIHPGYGFLSENAAFAESCTEAGIVFIGPEPAAIRAMGSKAEAKARMEAAGVPLVPGYHGDDQDEATLRQAAADIGYPVLLKAVAGGGGKGMRIVSAAGEFDEALAAARREAENAFGDDAMLVEKYLDNPRHVEIQVFADTHDNVVHLFERDCSVQRRHQKILEEAPAPGVGAELRARMGGAAVAAARAIDYRGAGTVEFLLDADGRFYFMEMNTRLQVEHPVTEMITGQDLVEWQLRVAAGQALPLSQDELAIHGHAIEARVYAEDPDNDFLPSTGELDRLTAPAAGRHVRVDTGVARGDTIGVHYDPMIAKLIVWDESRDRALTRLARALVDYRIDGVTTNLAFLYTVARSRPFREAQLSTRLIERYSGELFGTAAADVDELLQLASLFLLLNRERGARARGAAASPWNDTGAWRLNAPARTSGSIVLEGTEYDVPATQIGRGDARRFSIAAPGRTLLASGTLDGSRLLADLGDRRLEVDVVPRGDGYLLFTANGAFRFALPAVDIGDAPAGPGADALQAPMNGTVIRVDVGVGDTVEQGQTLAVIEAMKMEHAIRAPADGTVAAIHVRPGELVAGGVALLALADDEATAGGSGST